MRRRAAAVSVALLLSFAAPQRADAGAIKHWGTFPGREVRAVAFRGAEMGANPGLGVVPGRDGYVYVLGKWGVYRVLDADGRWQKVLTPAACAGGGAVDVSTWIPSLVCARNGRLVRERAGGRVERFPIPRPRWAGASDVYSSDYDVVTGIFPGRDGAIWFAYGYARGIGYRDAAGHTTLWHVAGLSVVRHVEVLGDDVYLADESCRVAHVRASGLVGVEEFHCDRSNTVVAMRRTKDMLWLVFGNDVVSIDRRGRRQRRRLPISAQSIAVDRGGTTYVLGADDRGHAAIATIDPHGSIESRTLPMQYPDSIAFDQRGRLWIGVSFWRAFAVVAPKGAWG